MSVFLGSKKTFEPFDSTEAKWSPLNDFILNHVDSECFIEYTLGDSKTPTAVAVGVMSNTDLKGDNSRNFKLYALGRFKMYHQNPSGNMEVIENSSLFMNSLLEAINIRGDFSDERILVGGGANKGRLKVNIMIGEDFDKELETPKWAPCRDSVIDFLDSIP